MKKNKALIGTLIAIPVVIGAYFFYKKLNSPKGRTEGGSEGGGVKHNISEGGYDSEEDKPYYLNTKSGTRLRKEASTNSTILKTYEPEYELLVIGESTQSDGLWYHVKDESSNMVGYMRSDVINGPYTYGP